MLRSLLFLTGLAAIARADDRPKYVPGRYIIQLKPGSDAGAIAAHHEAVRRLARRDNGALQAQANPLEKRNPQCKGNFHAYVGNFDDQAIKEIEKLPNVLCVEPDDQPSTNGTTPNNSTSLITQQSSSIWNLDDLSHKDGVQGSTSYTYAYDASAGEGTTAYVFDTGIRSTHEEFQGRVRFGINALTSSTDGAADGNNDNTGHGTHVAGTLGGKTYGVAKKTSLVDVKVFDTGSATMSSILAGLDWAFKDVQVQGNLQTAVFSISFGARTSSTSLDAAIKALYEYGILTVVAAGNENKEIGNTSPARLAESFTVGYTNQQRQRVDSSSGVMGSNYGPELDVWAPGFDIVSADYLSDTGSRVESGTSMATPLVSGLVCYLRAKEGGLGTPKAVTERISALAVNGVVGDVKDSKNLLVYNGSGQ
ncbi:subtilisin-like protein [Karstenula rhodostoma CBS 690.94]|uniref:Subtilisin-like protein n=1 Tax=Karstenula rhodostoma CBS 690.94 TaxID=1392251 RepID=A0A9P4PSA6_9PLEO|nr:subtilisin-like protein [Karstenula rhodostoma CBS 690.94]